MRPSTDDTAADAEPLDFADFGAMFVAHAVTPARIVAVVRSIAGEEISVGPIGAGPGGVARATAVGHIQTPQARHAEDVPGAYDVTVPVTLELTVEAAGGRHRYDVTATVRLALTVALQRPLAIIVEPSIPTHHDVDVSVKAHGMQAKLVGKMGDIDNEVKRQIAAYVAERIDTDAAAVTRIDLLPLIEAAWPQT